MQSKTATVLSLSHSHKKDTLQETVDNLASCFALTCKGRPFQLCFTPSKIACQFLAASSIRWLVCRSESGPFPSRCLLVYNVVCMVGTSL